MGREQSRYLEDGINAYYEREYEFAINQIEMFENGFGRNFESSYYLPAARYRKAVENDRDRMDMLLSSFALDLTQMEGCLVGEVFDRKMEGTMNEISKDLQAITKDAERVVEEYLNRGYEVTYEPINVHCIRLNKTFVNAIRYQIHNIPEDKKYIYHGIIIAHCDFVLKCCYLNNNDRNEFNEIRAEADKALNDKFFNTNLTKTNNNSSSNNNNNNNSNYKTEEKKSKMNMAIFVLLLLFFWPGAIVYYLYCKNKTE